MQALLMKKREAIEEKVKYFLNSFFLNDLNKMLLNFFSAIFEFLQ
jgi:hypothetical protein